MLRANETEGGAMPTYLITHEVDNVDRWWNSPKRAEVFEPLGITLRTFRDPAESNKVGLIAEIPDLEAFEEFLESETAAEAIRHDGVRMETLLVLAES
jgi:hypothetical protein